MTDITLFFPEIPHGHGLSFKKGIADGLLDVAINENTPHKTHSASYLRGYEIGQELKNRVAELVKP